MIDPAHQYATNPGIVGAGVAGQCARHLADLGRDDVVWDAAAADRAQAWFERVLRLGAKPFELLPWQMFVVRSLFGWKLPDGRRRFRRAYIETGKGSGKTPLAAGIALYMICADGEHRAEGYVCARTMEQSLVTYRDIVAMVNDSKRLRNRLSIAGRIAPYSVDWFERGAFIKRIATHATGEGRSGYRPHIVVMDEYHEQPSAATLDMMAAGMKSRKQPLTLITTNAGASLSSACGLEHTHALKVAKSETEADDYFPYVCELGSEDDTNNEKCWVKTNPSLPLLPGVEYIRGQRRLSAGMPSKRSLVDRLLFCAWAEAEQPWLGTDQLAAIECEEIDRSGPLYMALDLSAKRDLTAAAYVWDNGDHLAADVRIWSPADTLEARAATDNVPYLAWLEAGHIETCEGSTLDYSPVARAISEAQDSFDLRGIAYDPWRIDVLERELAAAGVNVSRTGAYGATRIIPHGQGFVSGGSSDQHKRLYMPRSIDAVEAAVLNSTLRIRENPCLRAALLGCVVIEDASRNRRFNKRKANTRIDPAVALTMAIGFAASPEVLHGTLAAMFIDDLKGETADAQ